MVKYVSVRDDRYILVTNSRARAERALSLYYRMKWSSRYRWLAIHGNVIAYEGRRRLNPGVYTLEEFLEAVKTLTPKWRAKLEEFLARPVVRGKRPSRPKVEVPHMRVMVLDRPHLRMSRLGSRYMVPRPLDYEYYRVDTDTICGRSEFKNTEWFWIQNVTDGVVTTVIFKKNIDVSGVLDAMASLKPREVRFFREVCDCLSSMYESLARVCALLEVVT